MIRLEYSVVLHGRDAGGSDDESDAGRNYCCPGIGSLGPPRVVVAVVGGDVSSQ